MRIDSQPLRLLAQAVRRNGGVALLVGGAVRDGIFRGLPTKDFDVEIHGMTLEQVSDMLINDLQCRIKEAGTRFGVIKTVFGGVEFDISLPRRDSLNRNVAKRDHKVFIDKDLSYDEAARRRDYTINSAYYDPIEDTVYDPFMGQRDLERGWLVMTSEYTFPDDATRVPRGMRFCGMCDLRADARTLATCNSMLGQYNTIRPEMIWHEWNQWALRSTKPSAGLLFLQETGWLQHYPELWNLQGVLQHPVYHPEGDVWRHTLQVVDELAGKGDVLMFAGLCHDFGKADMTEMPGDRHTITSHGHEVSSAGKAYNFMNAIHCPDPRLIAKVVALVANHMFDDRHLSSRAVKRLADRLEPANIQQLSDLMLADRMGRKSGWNKNTHCMRCGRELTDDESKARGLGPECLEIWRSQELLDYATQLECERNRPRPYLTGKLLIKHKLMAPGPEMGEFLRFAYHYQLEEHFVSTEGAIAFARTALGTDRGYASMAWEIWKLKARQ